MASIRKQVGTIKSTDNIPIYYELRGEGPPIVFVYGIACLINHWHHQIAFFSKTNTVITFDLRGHHKSTPIQHSNQLTISAVCEDILQLLNYLKISKSHFVGHSFGTSILLALYEKNPEIIESLTFVNGFSRNPIHGMFGTNFVEKLYFFIKSQYFKNSNAWELIWKKTIDNPVSMYAAALAGGFNIKLTQFKDIEVYTKGVASIDLVVFFAFFDELMKFNGQNILKKIKIPTLIISGEKDGVTPKVFQQEFKEQISNSEFVLVPYGSHCTQLDFPDYFNLKLLNFLNKITQKE